MIARPALRYHGGKFRLSPWIVSHLPPHVCYVEPYGGAMSVLLAKPPSRYEVYNDADGDVVAFFRVLRDRPSRLKRAIALTPYAREELRLAWDPAPPGDDLERARRLYVRCWQARCTHAQHHLGSWRYQRRENGYNVAERFRETDHLLRIAARLKTVQIECDDAVAVIRRYDTPDTLFYIDPPYLPSVRSRPDHGYAREMREEEHQQLARVLGAVAGMVIVSAYPSPVYDALYAGWTKVTGRGWNQVREPTTEVLWISPRCRRLQPELTGFEEGE